MRRVLLVLGMLAAAAAGIGPPGPAAAASPSAGAYRVLGPPRVVDARNLPPASTAARPQTAPRLGLHHDAAAAIPRRGAATASGTTLEHLTTFAADSYKQQRSAFGTDQALAPPDNSVAAGPTYVAEFVNSSGWIYSKDGTLHASFDLNSLFGVPAGYSESDPRLVYDTVSGRWFASSLAFNSANASQSFVAVSTTGDPGATWFVYTAFSSTTELGDQPRLGVSTDKVMLAWDDYRSSNLSIYDGEEERVIDKAGLVAGSTPGVYLPATTPDPNIFALVPATLNTSNGSIYAFYNDSDATNLVENQGSPKLAFWLVTGTVSPLTVTNAHGYLATPATTKPPSAPQLGSNRKIDTGDDRMLTVTYRGGTIWASANDGCTPNGDSTVRSCLRLWQVTAGANVSLTQDFDTGQSGSYLFYPAVGIDGNGNQVTVFSTSSASSYPGTSVSGELAGSTGALAAVTTLEPGLGPFTGFTGLCGVNTPCRWGDYFAAAPDPIDAGDVWVAGEYQASSSGGADWGTDLGRLTWSAPAVTGVAPSSGPACTTVTVTGSDFVPGTSSTSVSFGGVAATGVTVQGPDSLTATAPGHALGTVDVTTTTADGTSATGAADQFTYVAGPSVTGVSPSSGPAAGGTAVTVSGCGFTGATAVDFGANAAAGFTVNSDSSITATSPAGTGTVDVTVTVSGVTSAASAADHFTYNSASAPTVTGLSPTSGATAGGTSVTVTGTGFTGATAVDFGGSPASFSVSSSTSITATSPPGCPGPVDVTITTPNGTSASGSADRFTYATIPTVTSVSPANGPISGGTSVTILGSGLSCASAVSFGGVAAAGYSVNSDGSITATSPVHAAGTVDVTVTTGNGTSATSSFDKFTFLQTYYFTWFDRISSPGFVNDNIHVVNPGGTTANVTVSIPGCADQVKAVSAGQEAILTCANGFGGPVRIVSDQDLVASQRVQYYQSFNEVPTQPASAAQTSWQFAWYDHLSSPGFLNDNIHIVNPGPVQASVNVHIPGQPACDFAGQAIAAGGYHVFSCSTGFGGPATVTADKPVLASQRVQYYQTFNEVWAEGAAQAETTLELTWFDRVSSPGFVGDNVHVWNPTGAAFGATASIPGCADQHQDVSAGQEAIFSCSTGFGGPVTVTSTGGAPLLASERVQYYQSFNEVPAAGSAAAASKLYFTWYDHASSAGFVNDNIHVVNPTGALNAGQVSVAIPGCTPGPPTQASASELIYSCPFGSGFGGPVVITTTGVSVLASQRVQYYQSFNEVLASS